MAGDETTPLLSRTASPSGSHRSHGSIYISVLNTRSNASESTPLLLEGPERASQDDDDQSVPSPQDHRPASPDSRSIEKNRRIRWPIVIALAALCLAVITILVLGFVAPSAIQEYAKEAAVFEPISLSIAAFTQSGVRTRVRASFYLDASRVEKPIVRNIGRFVTWVGKEVESGESKILVYLPEYKNALVGTAKVPPVKVNIRNGHTNFVDVFADLEPGDLDEIRQVGNQWLEGRLDQLRVKGVTSIPLRSGLLQLGAQDIAETFVLQGQNLPDFPDFNITKLNIHELQLPGKRKAVAANISLLIQNEYTIKANVPPLAFDILLPNCVPGEEYILLGNATSDRISIEPKKPVTASLTGYIHQVPDTLTAICPGKTTSPLDHVLQRYMKGLDTIVYVRGGSLPSSYPEWLEDLLRSVTVPIAVPSKGLSNLIRRFSMSHVQFYLPEPLAEPDTPEAQPRVSALVEALVDLPEEMNVSVNVSRVRTVADVYYHDKKLGYIDLQKWQAANAKRIGDGAERKPVLLVEFDIKKAPLQITDEALFTEVLKKVIFDQGSATLEVKGEVTAELDTALGQFRIRGIPANGNIVVKAPLGRGFTDVNPKIESIRISHTTKSSIALEATLNFTNPTPYTANVPFVDLKLIYNGSNVANITGRDLLISPGFNPLVRMEGFWNPSAASGEDGVISGRKLISRYISGLNTSVVLKPHSGSIPALPALGEALARFQVEVPVPKLRLPSNGGDDDGTDPGDHDQPHFIKDATMHLWTSTADFTLLSPLSQTTLFITSIDATALYNRTTPIGRIQYGIPFPVPPGVSQTPRLPVELDLGGAGYEALKRALGGTLEIDAIAEIGIKLSEYVDTISYWGTGIGARVRL